MYTIILVRFILQKLEVQGFGKLYLMCKWLKKAACCLRKMNFTLLGKKKFSYMYIQGCEYEVQALMIALTD